MLSAMSADYRKRFLAEWLLLCLGGTQVSYRERDVRMAWLHI
jgi:hypothetical protein